MSFLTGSIPPGARYETGRLLSATALLLIFFSFASSAPASTYVDVGDDIYAVLARLEAEGMVRSALLTTRPISRTEAVRLLREAEENSKDRGAFIKSLVRELRDRIRPETAGPRSLQLLDSVYATYIQNTAEIRTLTYGSTKEKQQAFNADNDGDLFARDGNGRIGFVSRLENVSGFSFFLNPEFRSAHDDGSSLVLKKGYAVYDFGWDLIIGRDSQWWGPGYRGSLLLSNNAEPLTFVKIANHSPFIPPWIFKYMGPTDFSFFVTQLEHDRPDVPSPYLWGMRLNFKPHPGIEIGLTRTAMLGGKGRPDDLDTWLKSIIGLNQHGDDDTGDQRIGYDVTLTVPLSVQPFQVYTEGAAEDTVGWRPVQWAYLYGLYLPRMLSFERLEFRAEWAQTYDGNEPSSWYTHHIYTAGYTYHELIIGHPMGTNSRDLFLELSCRFPEKAARVSLAYDRTEHNISTPVREVAHEVSARAVMKVSQTMDLDMMFGHAWIDNVEFVPGEDRTSYMIGGTITKRF